MISVVLPYRDAAATLREAIESVLADANVGELVLVDDGSRDEGPALVEAFAAADRRVVRVEAGGVGIARALNRGLEVARGDFIARMDGDDVSLRDRFAAQRALLEADPKLGAVGTRVEIFPSPGEGLSAYVAWQNALISPVDHARSIFVEAPLCHPSTMMRRATLLGLGGYRDGDFPEDYDLWLRMDAAGLGLAKVDALGLRWRTTAGRATFNDARYAPAKILALRAAFLARRLARLGKPFVVWGAGKTGRHLARALASHDARPELFVDIDPDKIGRSVYGTAVRAPNELLEGKCSNYTIIVAVGARGARTIVTGRLAGAGFVDGVDFFCAS